jgi:hypothetical protein
MSSRSGIRGKNFQKDKFENLSQEMKVKRTKIKSFFHLP